MGWIRAYRVSKPVLRELREAGVSEHVMTSLENQATQRLFDRKSLEDLLDALGPVRPREDERALILRLSKMGLLRLDYLLPDRTIREWVEALVIALVVAQLIKTFFFAPFRVPTGSMIPTIQEGDHLFASVFTYGVRIPFTDTRFFAAPVERGDIVIFPFPKDPGTDFIKRVVALPGERVAVRDDKVYINGQPLNEPYAYHDSRGGLRPPDYPERMVPEGHFFVMGDNRYHSLDGRAWGFVRQDTVIGKGQIIYWSHDPAAGWFEGYRFGRIAKMLE